MSLCLYVHSSITPAAVLSHNKFYLKPLVLQDLLDGHQLSRVAEFSLVDDAKRAIADDLGVRVADFLWPVGALAWGGHNCRYLAAIFVPCRYRQRHKQHTSVQIRVD